MCILLLNFRKKDSSWKKSLNSSNSFLNCKISLNVRINASNFFWIATWQWRFTRVINWEKNSKSSFIRWSLLRILKFECFFLSMVNCGSHTHTARRKPCSHFPNFNFLISYPCLVLVSWKEPFPLIENPSWHWFSAIQIIFFPRKFKSADSIFCR